jgi:predicted restriction endonuclease
VKSRNWTRNELLVCFNFYCKTPFGKLTNSNADIVRLASVLGRTPSAVAMKLVNFASFDPAHKNRGVKGLANASRNDKIIWEEFNADPTRLAQESEDAYLQLSISGEPLDEEFEVPSGPTEQPITRPMRLVQGFFRKSVLASYRSRCAFCRLNVPELLNASHIIPWKVDENLRADPRNGLCLCCLHDRAFDRGLMGVNDRWELVLSPRLKTKTDATLHKAAFLDLEGRSINLPEKFAPYQRSLKYHFSVVFK